MTRNRSAPDASVIPVLAYQNVAEDTRRLCEAFGLRLRLAIGEHRAQLVFGGGAVIATRGDESGTGHSLLVSVEDADAHDDHAVAHGARIVNPPTDYPYGERQYTAVDIGGHQWTFSQSLADVDPSDWGGVLVDE